MKRALAEPAPVTLTPAASTSVKSLELETVTTSALTALTRTAPASALVAAAPAFQTVKLAPEPVHKDEAHSEQGGTQIQLQTCLEGEHSASLLEG